MKRLAKCAAAGAARPELAALLTVAGRAALAAGAILRKLYGAPHQIKHKGEIDLVTEADVAAEEAILTVLRQERPGVAILTEESPAVLQVPAAEPVWIVDPLDGTTNFAHGFPWFGVSIAYALAKKSLVGVVYCPLQDELFCACAAHGAWLNGEPIRTSTTPALLQALVATGFPYDIHQQPAPVLAALQTILTRAQGVRRAGAAALDLAYVACGRLDGFWEIKLKPWDTAAGRLLVEEAGGRVSDFQGNQYWPDLPEILASNGLIHQELTALLKDFSLQPDYFL